VSVRRERLERREQEAIAELTEADFRLAKVIEGWSDRPGEPTTREKVAALIKGGWLRTKAGWEHPEFDYPWEREDAYKLQAEANAGGVEPLHRALRGEMTRG
jgi:hypothetical protein